MILLHCRVILLHYQVFYYIIRQLLHLQAIITSSIETDIIKTGEILPNRHKFFFRNCLTHEYVCRRHFVVTIIATCDQWSQYAELLSQLSRKCMLPANKRIEADAKLIIPNDLVWTSSDWYLPLCLAGATDTCSGCFGCFCFRGSRWSCVFPTSRLLVLQTNICVTNSVNWTSVRQCLITAEMEWTNPRCQYTVTD